VAGAAEILAGSRFNGDGIVPADSANDEPTRRAIEDVIKVMGGKPDRSGKPGVDQPTIDKFFEEVAATVACLTRLSGTPPFGRWRRDVRGCGSRGCSSSQGRRLLCPLSLAAFDGRAVAVLGPTESDLAALAAGP